MKRAFVLCLLTFWMWSAIPAGANTITRVALDCDSVDVSWAKFPERDVTLRVRVEQGDEVTTASLSTESQSSGEASVPVHLHSGPASASVAWTLRNVTRHAGPVTDDLSCTPEPTTSTTEASTTTTAAEGTTVPPTTNPPPECGPGTLPCTGTASSTDAMVLGGWAALFAGLGLLALTRPRRRTR